MEYIKAEDPVHLHNAKPPLLVPLLYRLEMPLPDQLQPALLFCPELRSIPVVSSRFNQVLVLGLQ